MKTYKHMNVGDVIDFLEGQNPEVFISDLNAVSRSYRGYYDRVAIEPGSGVSVRALLDELKGNIGTTMVGYKGGEFPFERFCPVYVAGYGETGPALIGFDSYGASLDPAVEEETW